MSMTPHPADDFEWVDAEPEQALMCKPLAPLARHLFTTRRWPLGASAGAAGGAWDPIAGFTGLETARLLRVHQVHGSAVVVHRAGRPKAEAADADIIVTDDGDAAIAVQTADCVPLLIADSRTGAVAAAHAGWRGTALGVAATVVTALAREFGSRAEDLVAAVGPAIGPCCYEVGAEVRGRFAAEGFAAADLARWFAPQARAVPHNPPMPGLAPARPGRWHLDLWSATRDQLTAAGIPSAHVFVAELCTASHPDTLCSYRRDGPPAGRMAAVIRKAEVSSRKAEGSR